MIIAAPALWLPPERPAIVRAANLDCIKRNENKNDAIFPFPFFVNKQQTGNDANTLLLLHMDGTNGSTTFTDSSASALTITRQGSAQLATSTPSPKFGTASCNLNTGGFSWSSTAFNNLTTLTIDFWGYNLTTAVPTISCAYASTYVRFYWQVLASFYASSNGSSWNVVSGGALGFTAPSNTWTHYAIVCDGTNLKAYQDGSQVGSFAFTLSTGTTGTWSFGGAGGGGYSYTGFVDEFRVSNIARWTSAFTPPTQAYGP